MYSEEQVINAIDTVSAVTNGYELCLLADLFLYSYESEFLQKLVKDDS